MSLHLQTVVLLLLYCRYCCCVKRPAHRNSKSRVDPLRRQDSRPPTRSYTAAGGGVAVRCCCCFGLDTHAHAHKTCATDRWVEDIYTTVEGYT